MFLLDTNVVSELMRNTPNTRVLSRVDEQLTKDLFVTAVTEAEIRTGVAVLPEGTRRRCLAQAAERTLNSLFVDRVLPFDGNAAMAYAEIFAACRTDGRPISQADCQIAAIAHSQGMRVVTRNIRDFIDIGIEVIDPWTIA
ncbi:MAG: type II toxin-antitoxin system VapC family toxin [Aestuariivita sp.]|nr:type II toxin-antitoxin system VapC family toxin [Aestuariivita sp.]